MGFSLKSIFGGGGGGVPSFNPLPLRDILQKGAQTQRGIVGNTTQALSPINTQLRTESGQLGDQFKTNVQGLSDKLQQGAVNPAATNAAIGAKQEQEFRGVPAAQRAIREALASSNQLATGRGAAAVAQPVIAAAQNTSDFGSALNLQNEQARQDALKTGISLESQAELSKLGLDEQTMRDLFAAGRGDIIQEAADLLGIEGDLSQGLFNLENTTQQAAIAKAQAEAANRSALRNALLGIGGNLAGIGLTKLIPQRTIPSAAV